MCVCCPHGNVHYNTVQHNEYVQPHDSQHLGVKMSQSTKFGTVRASSLLLMNINQSVTVVTRNSYSRLTWLESF